MIDLKKKIVYEKKYGDKLIDIELNTPRSLRSGLNSGRNFQSNFDSTISTTKSLNNSDFFGNTAYLDYLTKNRNQDENQNGLLTNRSLMLTNRTNKSVRFEDSNEDKNKKLDPLTNDAVNTRYKKLVTTINSARSTESDPASMNSTALSTSNSLPLTPRSMDGTILSDFSNYEFLDKQASKSLESLVDKINLDFIRE